MSSEQLEQFIQQSPLSDSDKKYFLGMLASDGETKHFYDQLHVALINSVSEKLQQLENDTKKYIKLFEDSKIKYEQDKQVMEEELDQELAQIDVQDLITRQRVWEKYLHDLFTMQRTFMQNVRQGYSKWVS